MKLHRFTGLLVFPFMIAAFYVVNKLWRQPRTRVVVYNQRGQVLLVRTWGGRRAWGLPGGGVHRREPWAAAARRELMEETGIVVAERRLHYLTTLHYADFPAPLYVVTVHTDDVPAHRRQLEITDREWFSLDDLPHVSPYVHQALTISAHRQGLV